jgi:hypothetical protein
MIFVGWSDANAGFADWFQENRAPHLRHIFAVRDMFA